MKAVDARIAFIVDGSGNSTRLALRTATWTSPHGRRDDANERHVELAPGATETASSATLQRRADDTSEFHIGHDSVPFTFGVPAAA